MNTEEKVLVSRVIIQDLAYAIQIMGELMNVREKDWLDEHTERIKYVNTLVLNSMEQFDKDTKK